MAKYSPTKIVKALVDGKKIKRDWWFDPECIYLDESNTLMRVFGDKPDEPQECVGGPLIKNIYENKDWVICKEE